MSSITSTTGSAGRWGPLWGAKADDWAANEEQQLPTYKAALSRIEIASGTKVLEVGCGSGVFLRLAADRGAQVFGLDASEELLALARRRVSEADLREGDMQFLPHDDDSFDVVAGFNSFFFAADMVAALREAGRVAKSGAPVVVQVWGRPERCSLDAMKHALAPFLPPPDPNARRGSSLWQPGVLEELVTQAGLEPTAAFDITCAYEYAHDESLVAGMFAAGGIGLIAEAEGCGRVEDAVLAALRRYRTPDGGYLLENEWHFVISTASG